MFRRATIIFVLAGLATPTATAEPPVPFGKRLVARDTLNPKQDGSDDAQACLDGLVWPAAKFEVRCERARDRTSDMLIRFPSPVPSGDANNDLVALEWYVARDEANMPVVAPAVVVVHESGSGMTVGRMFARGLRLQGLHAFMIQLPYYGERRVGGKQAKVEKLITLLRQAVADVRRTRDAVAALPLVDTKRIALQGTSLGGFVSATAASIDDGYDQVFIMLAGGDLFDVIQNGDKDAKNMRDVLAAAGFRGDKLKALLAPIEPTRIAHRLDPRRTWLYSARFDKVVPPKNAGLLARAARLDDAHHVQMLADHYTGVIYLPYLLTQIRGQIEGRSGRPKAGNAKSGVKR